MCKLIIEAVIIVRFILVYCVLIEVECTSKCTVNVDPEWGMG